ncbi:hypothetical protein PIB30_029269 [Stylosanthes scabra]|uniref:Uncharacterized protein n=1 Tax=Stylosanthes scabra TaxID=79078 RepID=A0ABU6UCA9_9FABA|nr:hypothetical protein [Stylosanthes scabra]
MWRDTRGNLFNKFYDDTNSIDENFKHRYPEEIDQEDWKAFLEYCFEEETLEKYRKNTENHSKQLYTHIGESKSMARRREEEKVGMNLQRSCLRMIHLHKFLGRNIQDEYVVYVLDRVLPYSLGQGDDLPPEIASDMNALGSGMTISDIGPSSDNLDILSPP